MRTYKVEFFVTADTSFPTDAWEFIEWLNEGGRKYISDLVVTSPELPPPSQMPSVEPFLVEADVCRSRYLSGYSDGESDREASYDFALHETAELPDDVPTTPIAFAEWLNVHWPYASRNLG